MLKNTQPETAYRDIKQAHQELADNEATQSGILRTAPSGISMLKQGRLEDGPIRALPDGHHTSSAIDPGAARTKLQRNFQ